MADTTNYEQINRDWQERCTLAEQRADRWREMAGRLAAWMRAHQEHAAERCLGCEDVLAEFYDAEAEDKRG